MPAPKGNKNATKKEKKVRVNFRIEKELLDKLDEVAKKSNKSRTFILELMLKYNL